MGRRLQWECSVRPPRHFARRPSSSRLLETLAGIDICCKDLTLRRTMRGTDTQQSSISCLISHESVVPSEDAIRRVKVLADEAMAKSSAAC